MRRCEATVSSHQAPIVRVNLCCYDRGVHGKEVEVRGRLAKGAAARTKIAVHDGPVKIGG